MSWILLCHIICDILTRFAFLILCVCVCICPTQYPTVLDFKYLGGCMGETSAENPVELKSGLTVWRCARTSAYHGVYTFFCGGWYVFNIILIDNVVRIWHYLCDKVFPFRCTNNYFFQSQWLLVHFFFFLTRLWNN